MKKIILIFIYCYFFSNVFSQNLSPKNAVLCSDYPQTYLYANSDTLVNLTYHWTCPENGIDTTTIDSYLKVYSPGKYICQWLNINSIAVPPDTSILYTDTAYVFYLDPKIYPPTNPIYTLDTNSYNSILNQTPNFPITRKLFYTWDFGDGSSQVSDSDLNVANHSYDFADNFWIKLNVKIDACTFSDSISLSVLPKTITLNPTDTLICDTNSSFAITSSYINTGLSYIWQNIGLASVDTSTIPYLMTNQNGEYLLTIINENQKKVATGTANIYKYDPPNLTITAPSGFVPNKPINFVADTFVYPSTNLYNSTYTWLFGDGTNLIEVPNNQISHSFSSSGIFYITLKQNVESCVYVHNDSIFINQSLDLYLHPKDTIICNLVDNFKISLTSVSSTYPDTYSIVWSHLYKNGFASSDTSYYSDTLATDEVYSINANSPGIYTVKVMNGTDILLIDTAYIHYFNKDIMDIMLTANDQPCDSLKPLCSYTQDINFKVQITSTSICNIYDLTDAYFSWDFGDNNVLKGMGLSSVSHHYDFSGNYKVRLSIIDYKNSEHLYNQTIIVYPKNNDTLTINYTSDNKSNIIIDVSSYDIFKTYLYKKNAFIDKINSIIIPNNNFTYSINVSESNTLNVETLKDIWFYAKFSGAGGLKMSVITPDSKQIFITPTTFTDSETYIWGFPSYQINNNDLSITNTYYFGEFADSLIDNTSQIPWYYSPDGYFTKITTSQINEIKSGYYKTPLNSSFLGTKINGLWTFNITTRATPNQTYGKIEGIGLIVNKDYFRYQVVPDSMVCTDQNGRTLEMDADKQITIINDGADHYSLTCQVKYKGSPCPVQKNIEFKLPKNSTVQYFTPNGDGINDYWLPVSGNSNVLVTVIDKTGKIAASFNTNDNPDGWDGTFNGKPLPSDSYWYILKTAQGTVYKGIINIVR